MTNVISINKAPSLPQGPKVPKAYVRQGRDEKNTRSNDRPDGSVSGDRPFLSEAAELRLQQAGLLIAAAGLAGGALFLASKMDKPVVHDYNPSGIITSGAESE